jgi:cysteine desulfurase
LNTARDLEKEGVEVIYLPVCKEGFVDIEILKRNLTKNTVLVSVIFASNEIGTIQPISAMGKIIKDFRGNNTYPLFHVDAVQAFQFLDCGVSRLNVDLMTLSAQKIYGPKGIGALYARKSAGGASYNMEPVITGGDQEYGLRSGTEDVPAIVGFSRAVELVQKVKDKEAKRIKGLRDYFWRKLHAAKPELELNGPPIFSPLRLPNNLNIYFPGRDSQDLLIKFDLNGVSLSAGSACSARSTKTSHVIEALDLGENRAKSSLRVSLGRPTDKKQVDKALKRVINLLV